MAFAPDRPAPSLDPSPAAAGAIRRNLTLLVQLRWIAVAGQVTTIAVVEWGLRVRLPLRDLAVVLAVFVAGNIVSLVRLRRPEPVTNRELFFTLSFDAMILTALLYLSGGATNPFTSLYLLQVILGAVLLDAWSSWSMVGVASLCMLGLSWRHRPLGLPSDGPGLFDLYLRGAFIGLTLDAVLLAIFISRISANLRRRDERLAALRQRAAEEDHIVRMGLLASGAAHELGTPLATLDVILGDWRRMKKLNQDPEIVAEIEEMQSEVARCKAIVTGVLVSAGEARPEAAGVSTLKRYLADLFEDWRARRAPQHAVYEDGLAADPRIVADSAFKQALNNLLDNAFEASPEGLWMRARLDDDLLTVSIQDAGPGFTPETLAEVGKPYNSTKGRLGGGLGLFLVVNVVRKLGGRLDVRNRRGGGAEAVVQLPLSALTIEAAP
ncbi:ATP-binding protein [Phenylobacterium montanum]|uniref:histidine kinase n=1 Tax=Phenylobacterium montanum TaxID=2823693 RepID=A0A975G208_9CAUL|nr:ATP-binding protein [Caulobacter sp. S6]QUD89660.1 HAMP domain-containing histidine kinase [Caulobacter sp. S6]